MTRIIKINSCIECPYAISTSAKMYRGMEFKTKRACKKMLTGLEIKYFIIIDGVGAEMPKWCPLDYLKD